MGWSMWSWTRHSATHLQVGSFATGRWPWQTARLITASTTPNGDGTIQDTELTVLVIQANDGSLERR